MVKKLFALASVTALTGLVSATGAAGCSSTTTEPGATADSGSVDAGKKDSSTKPPTGDSEEPDTTGPTSCVAKDAIDATKYAYTKAANKPGACTQADLDALSAYIKGLGGADLVLADWQAKVSKTCAACVFTDDGGSEWGPFVTKDGKLEVLNSGGCIEVVSGNADCGKAYQQVDQCRLDACYGSPDCKTQDDVDTCLQDSEGIFGGPCKDSIAAVQKACGNNLGAYEKACQGTTYIFEGPVKVQCITGGGAGGSDAGDAG